MNDDDDYVQDYRIEDHRRRDDLIERNDAFAKLLLKAGATFTGKRQGPPVSEAEHFIQCGACGGWIDCRDLASVMTHEGPLPHPAEDQPQ